MRHHVLLPMAIGATTLSLAAYDQIPPRGSVSRTTTVAGNGVTVPKFKAAPSMEPSATLLSWVRLGAVEIDTFATLLPVAGEKIPSGAETTAYLGHTEDALYIAVECNDSRPDQIETILAPHDKALGDQVSILLDTTGNGQAGVELWLNPSGVQGDGGFLEGFGLDPAYDLKWQSSANLKGDGYIVRFRIPFASVPETGKPWNIRILRSRKRDRTYVDTWPRFANGLSCTLCQTVPLVFEGRTTKAASGAWLVIPTLTATRQEHEIEGTLGGPSRRESAGLDLRYRGATWGIDATYKPDFSAVEGDVDPLSVNSRYKVQFAEKRPFFQEGSDIFKGWNLDFIATRSILAPRFGMKARGEIPGNRWAVLITEDEHGGDSIASDGLSESMGRSTRDVAAAWQAIVGGGKAPGRITLAMSSRRLEPLSGDATTLHSSAVGLHYSQYFNQVFYLNVTGISSSARLGFFNWESGDARATTRKGTAASVAGGYSGKDWAIYAQTERINPDVRADLGFFSLTGFSRKVYGIDREWRHSGSWWTQFILSLSGSQYRYWDNTPLARNAVFRVEAVFKHQIQVALIRTFQATEWWGGMSYPVDGKRATVTFSGIPRQQVQASWSDARAIEYSGGVPARQRELNLGVSGFGNRYRYLLLATQVRVLRNLPQDQTPAMHALRWFGSIEYTIPPGSDVFVRGEVQHSLRGAGLPKELGNPRFAGQSNNLALWLSWRPGVFSTFSLGYTQIGTQQRFEQQLLVPMHVSDKGLFLKAAFAFGSN